ncbi:MAG: hypothetical protein IIC89_07570 [Chloroflexi bacterium]|nr:hypothetical protein [Chloroflexota bacterium]
MLSAVPVYSLLSRGSGPPRAAIVDQLSLTVPNPDFVESATETLERAGYIVDYYPGEVVTVEFFRNLPTQDYDFIILRNHAAIVPTRGGSLTELFTSEPFSPTKYAKEQKLGHLNAVAYDATSSDWYFGIGPAFIVERMRGKFDDTTVIMMGCNGLTTADTAEAFVRKGAETFISWSDFVSASHTDAATESLLENLLIEELSTEQAVAQTMAEVGPDPFYDAVLLSYPTEG